MQDLLNPDDSMQLVRIAAAITPSLSTRKLEITGMTTTPHGDVLVASHQVCVHATMSLRGCMTLPRALIN